MTWSMESTYEAAVAPADVFRSYADPATWGSWAHNTAWARSSAPLEPGSRVEVRVRSYPWTYTVRVRELEPGRRLVTEVRPFGVTITSTYEVSATPTRIATPPHDQPVRPARAGVPARPRAVHPDAHRGDAPRGRAGRRRSTDPGNLLPADIGPGMTRA